MVQNVTLFRCVLYILLHKVAVRESESVSNIHQVQNSMLRSNPVLLLQLVRYAFAPRDDNSVCLFDFAGVVFIFIQMAVQQTM